MRDPDGSRLARARELRKATTLAEARPWEQLRDKRFNNLKFVRQHPIGPYYVDFVCRCQKFIIEVDGATHSSGKEMQHDRRGTAFLAEQGYQVFRISNDEVLNAMDQVLALIAEAMELRG